MGYRIKKETKVFWDTNARSTPATANDYGPRRSQDTNASASSTSVHGVPATAGERQESLKFFFFWKVRLLRQQAVSLKTFQSP
jgi:hypothetical protein